MQQFLSECLHCWNRLTVFCTQDSLVAMLNDKHAKGTVTRVLQGHLAVKLQKLPLTCLQCGGEEKLSSLFLHDLITWTGSGTESQLSCCFDIITKCKQQWMRLRQRVGHFSGFKHYSAAQTQTAKFQLKPLKHRVQILAFQTFSSSNTRKISIYSFHPSNISEFQSGMKMKWGTKTSRSCSSAIALASLLTGTQTRTDFIWYIVWSKSQVTVTECLQSKTQSAV